MQTSSISLLSTNALKERIEAVTARKESILVELGALEAEYHCRLNRATRISKLSADILLYIFKLAQTCSDGDSVPIELRTSQVCSTWRRLTLNNPVLWSRIRLRAKSTAPELKMLCVCNSNSKTRTWWNNLKILELYATRFGDVSRLDVALEFDGWEDFFRFLAPFSSRFKRLSLLSTSRVPPADILQLISCLDAPLLEYLRVDFPPMDSPDLISPNAPSIFRKGAPALSIAKLRCGMGQFWYPPLQAITTLSLHSSKEIVPDLHLRNILACIPNLVNLALNLHSLSAINPVSNFIGGGRASAPLAVPSVRWLRLSTPFVMPWLRRNITFPNIETVELYNMRLCDVPPFQSEAPFDMFAFVRTLIIRDCIQYGPIKLNLASAFARIQILVIDDKMREAGVKTDKELDDNDDVKKEETNSASILDFSHRSSYSYEPVPWRYLQFFALMDAECLEQSRIRDELIRGLDRQEDSGGRLSLRRVFVPKGTKPELSKPFKALMWGKKDVIESGREEMECDWTRDWE